MFNALKATLARQKWSARLYRLVGTTDTAQYDQTLDAEAKDLYDAAFAKDVYRLDEDLHEWRARVLDFTWADIEGADVNRLGDADPADVLPEPIDVVQSVSGVSAAAVADALETGHPRSGRSRRRRAARARKKAARIGAASVMPASPGFSSRTPRKMPFEQQN